MPKNLERKKKEQTQGRTNRRMPICNPTIQLIVVNLYTKYEVSILNDCGYIFDEKVFRNYGRTEERTERRREPWTDVNQYTPPLFQSEVIIIIFLISLLLREADCKHPVLDENSKFCVFIKLIWFRARNKRRTLVKKYVYSVRFSRYPSIYCCHGNQF